MTSLLDIAPPEIATRNVGITRGEVTTVLTVRGLSALDLARLMKRFPNFRKLSSNGAVSEDGLMEIGLETVPAIIAMGLDDPTPENEKLVYERLTVEEHSELVTAIMELTNPEKPKDTDSPLAKLSDAIIVSDDAVGSGKDQVGNSL